MDGHVDETAARLRDALLASYPDHVRDRAADLGVTGEVLEAAIAEGSVWLAGELDRLLALPFDRQPRSPLELVQEAMRFPTQALAAAGASPPERDPVAVAALPGDLFELAPASSQDLGEAAWHAHLAWGVAKAAALTRPAAGLLSVDLMDRSQIEGRVGAAGYRLVVWRDAAAVAETVAAGPPLVAFVDLAHPDADAAIPVLAGAGVAAIAFGPHVDDLALTRARSLGAREALPRSRFFRVIPELLPPLL